MKFFKQKLRLDRLSPPTAPARRQPRRAYCPPTRHPQPANPPPATRQPATRNPPTRHPQPANPPPATRQPATRKNIRPNPCANARGAVLPCSALPSRCFSPAASPAARAALPCSASPLRRFAPALAPALGFARPSPLIPLAALTPLLAAAFGARSPPPTRRPFGRGARPPRPRGRLVSLVVALCPLVVASWSPRVFNALRNASAAGGGLKRAPWRLAAKSARLA